MQERNLQRSIKNRLAQGGAFCRKVSAEGSRGLPDLLVIYRGEVLLAEIKTPTGRLSKLQEITIERIKQAGGRAEVWRSVADAERFIRETERDNQLDVPER